MPMPMKYIVILMLTYIFGGAALAKGYENCKLDAPPGQAKVGANHGLLYFKYPPEVSRTYSGCQTVWDGKGNRVFVLTFRNGSLIKFEAHDPSGVEEQLICRYKHKKLVQSNVKKCPSYGAVKNGTRGMDTKPVVPLK